MSADPSTVGDPGEVLRRASAELQRVLRAGKPCRVEALLEEFPELASDPDRAFELVVEEFRLRQELGQCPDPREWFDRFPHWRERLRERLTAGPTREQIALDADTPQIPTIAHVSAEAAAPVQLEAPSLNHHELFEQVGHGGMGVVFRARDTVLDRQVALKMIRAGGLAAPEEVERFYREARAAARLRHPNIVPIHGIGLHAGQHCFTMDFLRGGNLAQHLNRYRQDLRAAVALMEKVAWAVQAAHDQGVIHRDLKPNNILLDEHGEPMVSDFGLAKFTGGSADLTVTGQAVGTPAYMAPEQASGRASRVTPRCDVWSLGVILYELLAGKRPFQGASSVEVTDQVRHADPPPPRRLRPDLPRDLETIILTCLEKDPVRRYVSAAALADDLGRWLRGEPIRARPPSWLRRAWRASGRHSWVTTAVVFVGFTATVLAALFIRRSPDPDDPLKEIQRQLRQGHAVTLIGETGPPRWSRWQTPQAAPGPSVAPDQVLTISSVGNHPQDRPADWAGIRLLELLPDAVLPSYRFRAEVWHETGNHSSDVGIYFAHRSYAWAKGVDHCFWHLTFNDLPDPPGFRAPGQPKGHPVTLYCRRYRPGGAFPIFDHRISGITPRFFAPAAPPTISWRKLAVEVTPEQVRFFWENNEIGKISREAMKRAIGDTLTNPRDPIDPLPDNSPGLALGLYVRQSTAAFRSVVVEPLEK